MGAADEITKRIRESYQLICAYEERRQTEEPKIKLSSEREINGQWGLIEGYLEEYFVLCQDLSYPIPEDIQQIAAHFPRFLAEEFKYVNAELRKTGPAGRLVSDQLTRVLHRFSYQHARLNELKEAHNLLQDCLAPILTLKGEVEPYVLHPDKYKWGKTIGRSDWSACQTKLSKLEMFAGEIRYTDIPFRRMNGYLEGPLWMTKIDVSRNNLACALKEGADPETLFGHIDVLWNECLNAHYLADKRLRDAVVELSLFFITVFGSINNGKSTR